MDNEALLSQIWGGAISLTPDAKPSGLSAMLTAMISAPLVVLESKAPLDRPYAAMETVELMEGVSFGDVLAEELELEVPYGAMILIEPEGFFEMQSISGAKLGELLGLALLDVAHLNAPLNAGAQDAAGLGNPIVALNDFVQNAANRVQ